LIKRKAKNLNTWTHDRLLEDLAIAKDGIPFINVCLGQSWDDYGKNAQRADLVVCRLSYKRFTLSVYEVKASRSDFLSDIRSGKYKGYLKHCHRFYFAIAKGIADISEIPEKAGLVIRNEKGWHTRKQSYIFNNDIDKDILLSLIFAKQRRGTRQRRIDDVQDISARPYYRSDRENRIKACRVLGKKMGLLHESAVRFGGLEKAIRFLDSDLNKNKRFI
jgi:hypothetical protein